MKNPELMEQYHKRLMKLLVFFDDLCRKNGIKYTAIDGTLLGAVRQQGMIPWDADIDVALTPKELEKLKKAFDNYEGRYYFNYLPNHYKGTKHNWADIRGGRIVDKKCSSAIFGIDVFTIDFLGDDLSYAERTVNVYKLYAKLCRFTTALHVPSLYLGGGINYRGLVVRALYPLLYVISKLTTPLFESAYIRFRNKRIDNNREDCKYFTIEPYFNRFGIEENTFLTNGYVDMPFGDMKVMCAKNYDVYLRATYGDYMTLPPKEKRTPYPSEESLTSCTFEDG